MSSSHKKGWKTRRRRQETREYFRRLDHEEATEARIEARRELDLPAGLKAYRKQLRHTQAQFGKEFGYSEKWTCHAFVPLRFLT